MTWGKGEGRPPNENGWGDRHEITGDDMGLLGELGEQGTTLIEAPDLEIFAKLSRGPLNTKTVIPRQQLHGISRTTDRQEGIIEESVRPKKREAQRRNTRDMQESL